VITSRTHVIAVNAGTPAVDCTFTPLMAFSALPAFLPLIRAGQTAAYSRRIDEIMERLVCRGYVQISDFSRIGVHSVKA
jgi:hypothetical protein